MTNNEQEIYQIIAFIMMFGALIFFIFLSWMMRCSNKTWAQRRQITSWVFSHRNYTELLAYYEAVDYKEHMWELIKFRDPFKLYDPDLFSTFHLIKHGPFPDRPGRESREVICPYTPKSV